MSRSPLLMRNVQMTPLPPFGKSNKSSEFPGVGFPPFLNLTLMWGVQRWRDLHNPGHRQVAPVKDARNSKMVGMQQSLLYKLASIP